MATLRSVNLKLNRADEILNALRDEIDAFLVATVHEVTVKTKMGVAGSQLIDSEPLYEVDSPDPPARWSVLIGDIASNLRCSLDHLACQLAVMNNRTPGRETAFPIFEDEAKYRSSGTQMIRLLSLGHQAIMDEFQPYPGNPNQAANHPLLVLKELRNLDTHREVHSLVLSINIPQQPLHSARHVRDGLWEFSLAGHRGKKSRIRLGNGDSLILTGRIQGGFPTQVVFGQDDLDDLTPQLLKGKDVLEQLRAIQARIKDIITRFSPYFP